MVNKMYFIEENAKGEERIIKDLKSNAKDLVSFYFGSFKVYSRNDSNKKIQVCVVYVQPDLEKDRKNAFQSYLSGALTNAKDPVIILGDFNLPIKYCVDKTMPYNLKTENLQTKSGTSENNANKEYLDLVLKAGYQICICYPTHEKGNCIDHIIAKERDVMASHVVYSDTDVNGNETGFSDHYPIVIITNFNKLDYQKFAVSQKEHRQNLRAGRKMTKQIGDHQNFTASPSALSSDDDDEQKFGKTSSEVPSHDDKQNIDKGPYELVLRYGNEIIKHLFGYDHQNTPASPSETAFQCNYHQNVASSPSESASQYNYDQNVAASPIAASPSEPTFQYNYHQNAGSSPSESASQYNYHQNVAANPSKPAFQYNYHQTVAESLSDSAPQYNYHQHVAASPSESASQYNYHQNVAASPSEPVSHYDYHHNFSELASRYDNQNFSVSPKKVTPHYDHTDGTVSSISSAQCDVCGKTFKNAHGVNIHKGKMHKSLDVGTVTNVSSAKCDICGKTFKNAHGLNIHKGKMHR